MIEFRLDYHALVLKYLGANMSSQEDLDAAVASLNQSIAEIDEKSTSTQESVDAIQVELDNLNAQVAAGQPVDLTGLNEAVAAAQQEAADLSQLASDAASSVPQTGEGTPSPEPPIEPPFDPGNPSQAPEGEEPQVNPLEGKRKRS